MCWVPWCLGMEPSIPEKPLPFFLVELTSELLKLDKPDSVKNSGLEVLKELLREEDCTEKFEGYNLFLYLLHNFGFQENLVCAVSDVLINVPEQQEDEPDDVYQKRVQGIFHDFVDARTPNLCRTALHYAAGYGYKWLVEKLILIGADVKSLDSNNANALHYTAGCDKTLIPEYVSNLFQERIMVDIRTNAGESKILIPKALCKELNLFAEACRKSPWIGQNFSSVQVSDAARLYALKVAHRALIIDLLIKEMLFHSLSDKHQKSPSMYAQEAGYLLLVYILEHQYPEKSSTEKFFHHGLRAWGTIFGCLNELLLPSWDQ